MTRMLLVSYWPKFLWKEKVRILVKHKERWNQGFSCWYQRLQSPSTHSPNQNLVVLEKTTTVFLYQHVRRFYILKTLHIKGFASSPVLDELRLSHSLVGWWMKKPGTITVNFRSWCLVFIFCSTQATQYCTVPRHTVHSISLAISNRSSHSTSTHYVTDVRDFT